jgi:hypothetical protein
MDNSYLSREAAPMIANNLVEINNLECFGNFAAGSSAFGRLDNL